MTLVKPAGWWNRPCGGRDVFRLALPLVISTASWSLTLFVDRMFLLWHSTSQMAAAMPAGMLHFTLLCFPLGVASYVNTFVAQYEGSGGRRRIGLAVWQGVRLGIAATPLFLLTIPLAPLVFAAAGHEPHLAALETIYYQVLAFGAGGTIVAAAMTSFFTGRGETKVVMTVDCLAAAVNVALDYAWIFGRWGFPAMGIEGAAWATVVSQWFKALLYWRLMMVANNRRTFGLVEGRRHDAQLMRRLLRFGGPNGLQFLAEVLAFSIFIMLVGRLGEQAMAATTLAFNVNAVAFIPMLGLGVAVTTIVGQQLGRNRPDMASRATWTALWMAMTYMGLMAALYVLVPDLFLMGHASGTPPEEFSLLRDTTVILLRFVAAYCLFDALNIVFVSAIKGAGDTRFVLAANLILGPPPIIAGWWGITRYGWGLTWCWILITAWICVLGLVYLARFLQGRWRTMRVIEPELADEPIAETPPECTADAVS